jgi:hypothetical protein
MPWELTSTVAWTVGLEAVLTTTAAVLACDEEEDAGADELLLELPHAATSTDAASVGRRNLKISRMARSCQLFVQIVGFSPLFARTTVGP